MKLGRSQNRIVNARQRVMEIQVGHQWRRNLPIKLIELKRGVRRHVNSPEDAAIHQRETLQEIRIDVVAETQRVNYDVLAVVNLICQEGATKMY